MLSYDPVTTKLTVSDSISRAPVSLLVPANTVIARQGQASFSSGSSGSMDLVAGTLVSVKFESNKKGQGVASQITILATPGADFAFTGNLSSLDLHSGVMTLVDSRDDKSYDIFVDAAHLPAIQNLKERDHVRITATYDGARYVATAVAAE